MQVSWVQSLIKDILFLLILFCLVQLIRPVSWEKQDWYRASEVFILVHRNLDTQSCFSKTNTPSLEVINYLLQLLFHIKSESINPYNNCKWLLLRFNLTTKPTVDIAIFID